MALGASLASSVRTWSTDNLTREKATALNPAFSIRTSYVPGLKLETRYVPLSSVSMLREKPVSSFRALTLVRGTTAPVWSVTVPEIEAICARVTGAKRDTKRHRVNAILQENI